MAGMCYGKMKIEMEMITAEWELKIVNVFKQLAKEKKKQRQFSMLSRSIIITVETMWKNGSKYHLLRSLTNSINMQNAHQHQKLIRNDEPKKKNKTKMKTKKNEKFNNKNENKWNHCQFEMVNRNIPDANIWYQQNGTSTKIRVSKKQNTKKEEWWS